MQELRNLYDREKVDAVVGYVGSGDCLAVAPAAEEMKKFLILYDCGTPRIFEDGKYEYVFRTASHAMMDNVALARYLKARNVKAEHLQLHQPGLRLGPGLAQGLQGWPMAQLYPGAKPGDDQLPKFGAGQYGTEISALLAKPADVTHSSLWGGDLQAFVLQAAPRDLFKRTQVVFSAADHVLPGLGDKMPDGVILGARGAYGLMSPKRALNDWWWKLYSKAYKVYPVQAPYRMVQSLLGLKLAVEKAMAANGGKKPTPRAARRGAEGLGVGFARRPHPHDARRRPPGDAGHRHRPHQVRRGEEDGDARRHPALPGRLRESAGGHEGRGLDQGRAFRAPRAAL